MTNCLLIKHKSKLYHFTKEGTIHIQFHLFRWNHPYLTSLTEALSDLSTLLIHASSICVSMSVRQKDKSEYIVQVLKRFRRPDTGMSWLIRLHTWLIGMWSPQLTWRMVITEYQKNGCYTATNQDAVMHLSVTVTSAHTEKGMAP